jgi:hypothetical protein
MAMKIADGEGACRMSSLDFFLKGGEFGEERTTGAVQPGTPEAVGGLTVPVGGELWEDGLCADYNEWSLNDHLGTCVRPGSTRFNSINQQNFLFMVSQSRINLFSFRNDGLCFWVAC